MIFLTVAPEKTCRLLFRLSIPATWRGGHRPPQLGDVEIRRNGDDSWSVLRGGVLVAAGLDKNQMLQLIRGEIELGALIERRLIDQGMS